MSEIVHITFEKITGLRGEIEGVFVHEFGTVDFSVPIIYQGGNLFTQYESIIYLTFLEWPDNYDEHFYYGVNFLIKEWSYGSGVDTGSKNPN